MKSLRTNARHHEKYHRAQTSKNFDAEPLQKKRKTRVESGRNTLQKLKLKQTNLNVSNSPKNSHFDPKSFNVSPASRKPLASNRGTTKIKVHEQTTKTQEIKEKSNPKLRTNVKIQKNDIQNGFRNHSNNIEKTSCKQKMNKQQQQNKKHD